MRSLGDETRTLYVTLDHGYFLSHDLLDVVQEFVDRHDGRYIFIDEIHRYPGRDWSRLLKNIYDLFPHLSIIFSGSSSIDLEK
jgi:predicted AAA+ superfamily ATPase